MITEKRLQHLHIKVTKKLKTFYAAIKNSIKHVNKILKWNLNLVNNHLKNSIKHVHKEKFQKNSQKFTMKKIPLKLKNPQI